MLGSMVCSCSLPTLDWAFPKNTFSVHNEVFYVKIVIWAGASPWSGFGGAPSRPAGLSPLRQESHVLLLLSWRCSAQGRRMHIVKGCKAIMSTKGCVNTWLGLCHHVFRDREQHTWATRECKYHQLQHERENISKHTSVHLFTCFCWNNTTGMCSVNNQECMAHTAKNISICPSP